MWDLDYKESWALKNWCFWTEVLEKTLESSLDCKGIQLVHPKGDQLWIFTGRTDAVTPILWPPVAKSRLFGRDPALGKNEGRKRRGWQRIRWLDHWLGGHEFEQALGDGDGQESLACYSPWGCKKSDTTEQLNYPEHGVACIFFKLEFSPDTCLWVELLDPMVALFFSFFRLFEEPPYCFP